MKSGAIDSCELFFGATGLPVFCFDPENNLIAWYPLWLKKTKPDLSGLRFDRSRNPDAITTESQGIYGQIRLPDGSSVVVGPAYSEAVNDEIARCYIRETKIPAGKWDLAYATLVQTDRMNFQKFTRELALLYHCLTGQKIAIAEHFNFRDLDKRQAMNAEDTRQAVEEKEVCIYNTYEFERKFYAQVQQGDVEKLLNFMIQYNTANFNRVHLADHPLRNAKNRFILGAAKLQALAAFPGKLAPEIAYQMTDDYILEAEKADSIAEIERLEYVMTTDFCRRIGNSRAPTGISQEIYTCMNFIREHTNERLSVNDVADHLGKSLSYLHTHFKEETGFSVRDYIMVSKLEEAARLLKFSERSLADISSYLCFSSQSYFQNVFKKEYGLTPMQYRQENQI